MSDDVAALSADRLAKRYRHNWALSDCTFSLPQGRIAGLVGPNGAGKSTLLLIAAGFSRPMGGQLSVLGRQVPLRSPETLALIGYLDQERPLYRSLRVEELLEAGRRLNPHFDTSLARHHLDALEIDLHKRAGQLSIGQQAQVSLICCVAKRPALLLLDEPVAALDPFARQGVMQLLLQASTEEGTTILLSSHALADLAGTCDYLILLARSEVLLADELDYVLASHRLLSGLDTAEPPRGVAVISEQRALRQRDLLVRIDQPLEAPGWRIAEPSLEELVIAYLREEGRRSVGSVVLAGQSATER
ncbi:MAG TPA: ABC transporter ATP-binding protein [Acidimicrobiales bacterium]|nr:ABC transporter ATP-binding protein [Acidimicrobiales bacterium]